MKLRGILGTASGKLGNGVAATVAGQTIMRQYQPNVKNPNTDAQVAQRARLKLASQLAATMSPVIVIPKQGLQSARNLFIKRNMQFILATDDGVECELKDLQITAGSISIPQLNVVEGPENMITISLETNETASIKRVIYSLFHVTEERGLSFIGSTVAEDPDHDKHFAATMPKVAGELVVYAYGMNDASADATAKYENFHVNSADAIAALFTSRALKTSDFIFTKTIGTMATIE